MSDAQPRTLADIQAEYELLCSATGEKQYRIEILKSELNQLNQRMLELNQESAVLRSQTQVPDNQDA